MAQGGHGGMNSKICLAFLTLLIGAAASGLVAPAATAAPQSPQLSPRLFSTISTGVAYVTTYTCGGRLTGQGSGFLIGRSVVMTARHVVRGACRVRVKVNGEAHAVTAWSYWRGSGRGSGEAEDVATLKLDTASDGFLFALRPSSPPPGANLAMVGHPLGNRVSLNQGKIIRKLRVSGVPMIAVKMLGAEGASGSAFVDDAARVVGILQLGLGAPDVLGQRTAGVVMGIDLSRVSSQIRRNLCKAYPRGEIRGCPGSSPVDQPPVPLPPPPAPTPAAPLSITECWVTTADSWEPTAKTFSLTPTPQTIYAVLRLNRTARASESVDFGVKLARPDGTAFTDSPFVATGQSFNTWRVKIDLRGRGQLAPLAGDWRLSMAMGTAAPCTFGVRVEAGTLISATPSRTSFDPNGTYSISLAWALLQDVETGASLTARLLMPNGSVASTDVMYISEYTTSGTEFLTLPFCYRSSFITSDTCVYGTYRVEILKNQQVIVSIPIEGFKP